ncbi:glycolate oxidase [Desulfacinum infernum DSM 9756]|jgi:glycolate oxidase|uniref:Glycolate oxidase n=1 Tax=Desulfacinum infernum DSM 9756 TaxID=1121391 RepID=A0A1M5GDS8_9BACT|nr:FAD-linked oxidase C-terminal domain-containing protein [Desulfacinum infernum]SHG01874.1 glycolate oxidase [Desulfacinum infernum DSM 9756]
MKWKKNVKPKSRLPVPEFRRICGPEHVLTAPEDRLAYSFDASKLSALPEAVILPGSAAEIAEILRLANAHGFPVYPRGAGSGMVGGAVPDRGGVVLALTRLNRILELDPDDMIAVVEPAVVTGRLQQEAARHGLLYPPDPASLSFSTIGGNVATCAGGPRAVKYGVTRDYVLGLEAVLPTGEVITTGTRTAKGVVGYDLTRLLVGSEGTLGVITRVVLRLVPAPEAVCTLAAVFPRIDQACRTVTSVLRARMVPTTLELLDRATLEAVEAHVQAGLPVHAEALLLLEVDGPDAVVDDHARRIEEICREMGARDVQKARDAASRERLWSARRAISPALRRIRPGKINEDVTVPRSRIPDLIRFNQSLARKYDLIIVSFGHAGDGNIHTNIMVDRSDPDEMARAERAVEELFREVLRLGGTLSGEHGIGITKSPFFQWEVHPGALDAMVRIKQALDPNNILNPGKMFVPNRAFFERDKG